MSTPGSRVIHNMMNRAQRSELARLFPDGILFDCPMDRYTTFRVGGKAEAICFVNELSLLGQMVSYLTGSNIPYLIVGRGSNLLVKDRGIQGVVVILRGGLASIEKSEENEEVLLAGGGLPISELLSYCGKEGLAGLEFLSGIPGTAGGAVFMNAGAWGQSTGEMVQELFMMTDQAKTIAMTSSELRFSYRRSSIQPGTIIYGVTFRLEKKGKDAVRRQMADFFKRRKESQPLDLPSGGSVFKNPPGDYAGRLIEEAGLKGKRIGGAMISPGHSNFIVNTGGARAGDVLDLMELIREKVKEKHGIDLIPEIQVVGDS